MKIYFISGLGADKRVFHHIKLPEGFEAVYVDWIKPLKNESLSQYAFRIAEKIDTNEPFGLIGLSMGGMMAMEIAKQFRPSILILISSIPCSEHFPWYYRAAGKIRLHKLVPVSLLKYGSFIKRFFTAETSEDKDLLRKIIRETDPAFIRWALQAIVKWDCKQPPCTCIHIHGNKDGILPMRFTKPTHVVPNGTHMMILTNAVEINNILNHQLTNISTYQP